MLHSKSSTSPHQMFRSTNFWPKRNFGNLADTLVVFFKILMHCCISDYLVPSFWTVFPNFVTTRVDEAHCAVFVTFLTFSWNLLCRIEVRHPGIGGVFQTVLLMEESVQGTDSLIEAVVDELLNVAPPDRVELEERQRAVEEGHVRSRRPQVDSDDNFVVAPKIVAMLRLPPCTEFCLCTIREGGTGSVIWGFGCPNVYQLLLFRLDTKRTDSNLR